MSSCKVHSYYWLPYHKDRKVLLWRAGFGYVNFDWNIVSADLKYIMSILNQGHWQAIYISLAFENNTWVIWIS